MSEMKTDKLFYHIFLYQLNRRCEKLSIAQQTQIESLPIKDIENLTEILFRFIYFCCHEIQLKV